MSTMRPDAILTVRNTYLRRSSESLNNNEQSGDLLEARKGATYAHESVDGNWIHRPTEITC
jgi:hypothetical protein